MKAWIFGDVTAVHPSMELPNRYGRGDLRISSGTKWFQIYLVLFGVLRGIRICPMLIYVR
jgi:hypothetical protein